MSNALQMVILQNNGDEGADKKGRQVVGYMCIMDEGCREVVNNLGRERQTMGSRFLNQEVVILRRNSHPAFRKLKAGHHRIFHPTW